MPIVNIAELTGEALNWAVGKAEDLALQIQPAQYGIGARVFEETPSGLVRYRPTVEWLQCGPIRDKYSVEIHHLPKRVIAQCYNLDSALMGPEAFGPDARTAICRAVVSAVSGPAVDVPGELF